MQAGTGQCATRYLRHLRASLNSGLDPGGLPCFGHWTTRRNLVCDLCWGAADGGTPAQSASMTLLVEVQDVNDNAPVFDQPAYSVSVLESLPANSHFLQVSATDRDTGNNARLSFRLTASGEFGIFPNSGLLYIREPLDREACDLHWLSVVVVDNGSPAMSATASVEVHVLDANDNAPEFSATSLELAVPENLPAGHLVGQLQARDQDAGSNAVLRYSLLHSNGSSFKVDPVTGDVHSLATLDREVQASYELLVRVQDQGTPTLSSTARLRISVVDENDNAPVFVEPLDRLLNVREHQPVGSELVQVRAVDADEGPNGQVIYEIVPGSGQQRDGRMAFSVDAHTGRLITRLVLDRESQEEFSLVVVARDRGHPPREARLALLVRVLGLHHLPGSATPGGVHAEAARARRSSRRHRAGILGTAPGRGHLLSLGRAARI
ncbi:hypothetical protein MRX96_003445 [Rhipicephalus microplus]